MFTERYMVDWLLQNTLGPMWLALCRKHGWTPEVEADGTLERLEERRTAWRARRAAGEVSLTALMPLHTDAERRWAYYVPQPIPDNAVEQVPASVRDWKILDPAVGSGHFLVVAMDLLVALYREEARHRAADEGRQGGEGREGSAGDAARWQDKQIVEHVLAHNLHGIDLDPRAVQIAAAALWLKAQQIAPGAHPERLNLVASNLRLSSLPDDDPALAELRREVERETGIPGALTDTIVHALRGADHLGSLLKIDRAVEEALAAHEQDLGRQQPDQGDLFEGFAERAREPVNREEAKASLLDRLESFLHRHSSGDDLGLRLRGEQLAAGVRFMRLVREGIYDLVVANPPYQGTTKMAEARYITQHYKLGKADLYAAFLLRGLQLARPGGVSAMLTMRSWMFIKQFAGLRENLLKTFDLRALGDFDKGCFESMPTSQLISIALVAIRKGAATGLETVALQPTAPGEKFWSRDRTEQKRAAVLCHVGRHDFDPAALKVVPEWPVVYWWTSQFLGRYARSAKLGESMPVRQGLATSDNSRFLRKCHEIRFERSALEQPLAAKWPSFIRGGGGRSWIEPLEDVIAWDSFGLELKLYAESKYGSYTRTIKNESWYGQHGVSFAAIGARFSASAHRFPGLFGHTGSSVFGGEVAEVVCLLNSGQTRDVLSSLNPGVHFEVGDVARVPQFAVVSADEIFSKVSYAFAEHESHRESSVELKLPGPSPWPHSQAWAQTAVDRPEGAPLPPYEPEYDPEPPTDHLSFALGVALGRFGPDGEGILDPVQDDLSQTLPAGILFLDRSLDTQDHRDSLGHAAAQPIHDAWKRYASEIDTKRDNAREWLALDFFKDVHKGMYENRPIHWPLTSANKTFVAWVTLHRCTEQTLRILLADHLQPTLTRFEGELTDLRDARDGADKKVARQAENHFVKVKKARDELAAFIADVEQCADRGALPPDAKSPAREQDARYAPDLDDGVMINAAALWPLLAPQWKDPKKWWQALAVASPRGNKDYDWSHLAMRYWPTRVDAKCQQDPSLGVAHGCFWRYHPERAWAWELRLQDEIGPDFRIEEAPYRPGGRQLKDALGDEGGDAGDGPHRDAWLRDHPMPALEAVAKEAARRMGRGKNKTVVAEMRILERGLWSACPAEVWGMELRLADKQKAEFCLRAPDEAAARAAYIEAHPAKHSERKQQFGTLSLLAEADPRA